MNEEVQRDLGRLEAQMEVVVKTLGDLEKQVGAISLTLAEARGGWRTLAWVSGASATLGGLIVKFVPFIGSLPK